MNFFSSTNSFSASMRIYRALLVAYPKAFREHYETHMVQVFRDSIREAFHHNGIPGVVELWIHTFVDLIFTALVERISERSRYMFSPKVIMWGGLAGAFGGFFWLMVGLAPSGGEVSIALALILGLGGLVGLYSRQGKEGGMVALAGFILGIIGTGLALVTLWWSFASGLVANMEIDPASVTPIGFIFSLALIIFGIGLMSLGVTCLRAKTLHRWRGLPLGLGVLGALQGLTMWLVVYMPMRQGQLPWDSWNFGFNVLYPAVHSLVGLGWIGLGAMLASEGEAQIPVAQNPSASA